MYYSGYILHPVHSYPSHIVLETTRSIISYTQIFCILHATLIDNTVHSSQVSLHWYSWERIVKDNVQDAMKDTVSVLPICVFRPMH